MPVPTPIPIIPTPLPAASSIPTIVPTSFLEYPWWQGVAGIFQILAGIFAIITILQARKMQKQAEKERRESVAPDWEIIEYRTTCNMYEVKSNIVWDIAFENTGLGLAKNPSVNFIPDDKSKKFEISPPGTDIAHFKGKGRFFHPEDWVKVHLSFHVSQLPLSGIIVITCNSRYGYIIKHKFSFSFSVDEKSEYKHIQEFHQKVSH